MADPEVQIEEEEVAEDTPTVDVDMAGAENDEGNEADAGAGEEGGYGGEREDIKDAIAPARITFIDYLKSPIVYLSVGLGDEHTLLTAHEALLVQSPWFEERIGQASGDISPLQIDLSDERLDAVGCFLQYLYTGEYFPRKLEVSMGLETDPSMPAIDDEGEQLLKHARVYTLADKLGVAELKTLAHSKIHRINSTAKGEIAYARFVYANTPREDATIRKPVAAFWAHRSHVLRHEAEAEFRKMCLEYPQFGFDVLSLVLDQKEKGSHKEHPGDRSARKRQRMSTTG
ncbi:MAG: hypothetical protein M1832_000252 [Thelocarpon impressellum]|nr:MAG: hypothetical protein M1832_000252 [Thelocarpon impressellum]